MTEYIGFEPLFKIFLVILTIKSSNLIDELCHKKYEIIPFLINKSF